MDKKNTREKYRRIVVKVGSSTLSHANGHLNLRRIEKLIRVLSDLKNSGREMILVSSGAVSAGRDRLSVEAGSGAISMKQAAAAVGQCRLMHLYDKLFQEYHHVVAQILITKDVTDTEVLKQNTMNTLNALLELNVLPIVNENDTIAIDELGKIESFGDNDTLSAVVCGLADADLLVILSDIDGLYDKNPKDFKDAVKIDYVEKIDDTIRSLAGPAGSDMGTGGMVTKIAAAEIATAGGTDVVIMNGDKPEKLYDLLDGEPIGTLFSAFGERV